MNKNSLRINNNKILRIGIIAILIFAVMIGVIANLQTNKNSNVFAAEIDYETAEIYDNGEIINTKLWNALKDFYIQNKTNDMPSIKTSEGNQYLTTDQFKNFSTSSLNLSNKDLTSIKNLSIFDLTSFTTIDLSNNKLTSISNELKNLNNLTSINLSNNELTSFTYEDLSQQTYSQTLTNINLSNNKISNCNLKEIGTATIDLRNNKITSEKLTYPTNDLNIYLSHNLISTTNLTKTNVQYGFQGVKNNEKTLKNTEIAFYGLDAVDKIRVFKMTKNSQSENYDESFVQDVEIGEKFVLENYGFYKIKFENENYDDIVSYVCPSAPELKMFQNGKEIELSHKISNQTEIRFIGEDNASFVVYVNGETKKNDRMEISNSGSYQIVAYQIVDGFESFATTFYIEYQKNSTFGIAILFGGVVVFGAVFYLIIKNLPGIANFKIGKKNDKSNLDV